MNLPDSNGEEDCISELQKFCYSNKNDFPIYKTIGLSNNLSKFDTLVTFRDETTGCVYQFNGKGDTIIESRETATMILLKCLKQDERFTSCFKDSVNESKYYVKRGSIKKWIENKYPLLLKTLKLNDSLETKKNLIGCFLQIESLTDEDNFNYLEFTQGKEIVTYKGFAVLGNSVLQYYQTLSLFKSYDLKNPDYLEIVNKRRKLCNQSYLSYIFRQLKLESFIISIIDLKEITESLNCEFFEALIGALSLILKPDQLVERLNGWQLLK